MVGFRRDWRVCSAACAADLRASGTYRGSTTYPPGMRVVEWWWNGNWGRLFRRDVRLQEDAGQWSLRIRIGPGEDTFPYRTEADARHQMGVLLADPQHGPWVRLDDNV